MCLALRSVGRRLEAAFLAARSVRRSNQKNWFIACREEVNVARNVDIVGEGSSEDTNAKPFARVQILPFTLPALSPLSGSISGKARNARTDAV